MSQKSKEDDNSMGNVDDVIVSAPYAVVVVVVLAVRGDGTSIGKSRVVVEESKTLSNEDGSENNLQV